MTRALLFPVLVKARGLAGKRTADLDLHIELARRRPWVASTKAQLSLEHVSRPRLRSCKAPCLGKWGELLKKCCCIGCGKVHLCKGAR